MNIFKMTKRDFELLPVCEWGKDLGAFDSLVILPLHRKHESGFRLLDFIACRLGEPICCLSGCSDVLHLAGEILPVEEWKIDCLPKSGLLHLFGTTSSFMTCNSIPFAAFYVYLNSNKRRNLE